MIGRILVAAAAICIGACASSAPDAPAEPATVDAAATDTAAPAGEIHDLDTPNVEQTASVAPEEEESKMVCRREVITGTKMSRNVCRHRADIEAREARGQDALRGMRKSGSQMERERTVTTN